MKQITRIVLTGGPCSGKSTFMDLALEYFTKKGYVVLVDHEAATDLITGGISPASMEMYHFQKYCIALQLKKEELFMQAAHEIKGDKVLVFYDRAILDDKGYVTPDDFKEILSTFDMKEEELIDRYDLILHLTTRAKSKAEEFSNETNAGRYENASEACLVDDTILLSWSVHPNHVIIEGEDNFDLKMQKTINAIETYLKGISD